MKLSAEANIVITRLRPGSTLVDFEVSIPSNDTATQETVTNNLLSDISSPNSNLTEYYPDPPNLNDTILSSNGKFSS